MDCIAGRKTTGRLQGSIRLNNKLTTDFNPNILKKLMGYVEQQDLHNGLATVRESLLFSAALRLPVTVTAAQRAEYVNEILDLLELSSVADKIVGNAKYSGLSQGQLKLLTIGCELAANTPILFLDEPTSVSMPNINNTCVNNISTKPRLVVFLNYCILVDRHWTQMLL